MFTRITRRTFLKQAVLSAGAATALEAPALLADPSPNSKLAVAVLGYGLRGQTTLEHALNEKVVAIVEVDDARLAAAAGLTVVTKRCMAATHAQLVTPREP